MIKLCPLQPTKFPQKIGYTCTRQDADYQVVEQTLFTDHPSGVCGSVYKPNRQHRVVFFRLHS